MSWSDVGNFLKGSLPVLGTALAGPLGGLAGGLVSKALGYKTDADPSVIIDHLKGVPRDNKEAMLFKLKQLETKSEIITAYQSAQVEQLKIVNETMRTESNSNDGFVRRWRPFYGYAVALSWAIQMIGFTVIFGVTALSNPENLANVVQQFALLSGSLVTLWGIALAVLGVSVHKRSLDKKVDLGDKEKKSALYMLTGGKYG